MKSNPVSGPKTNSSTDPNYLRYERFVKQVAEGLINDSAPGLVPYVRHNVRVRGRSGCLHQIDVYWEFEMAGMTVRFAIECKAVERLVNIGYVRSFYGVLRDTGMRGIMATTHGFQSGAKQFAKYYDIGEMIVEMPDVD